MQGRSYWVENEKDDDNYNFKWAPGNNNFRYHKLKNTKEFK